MGISIGARRPGVLYHRPGRSRFPFGLALRFDQSISALYT
jgi:hypothetical protein